ncbi:MAG: hypothetical protein IKL50_00125 [Bacteroidales bacterium]|nr:hypothetical protein [Bacteroidales bacterium]
MKKVLMSLFVICITLSFYAFNEYESYDCKRCNGSGVCPLDYPCSKCHGTKQLRELKDCPKCDGSGYEVDRFGDKSKCSRCWGAKKEFVYTPCNYCLGTGIEKRDCMGCNGTGKVNR